MAGFLQENDYLGATPLAISSRIEGMMTGWIDLVFRHQGKYYLADYKSNHLGYAGDAYLSAGLQQAITDHHYDLQYLIYTVALNRFLQQRLTDYQYERDFGGVYYLFLRGMDGTHRETGVYFDKPDAGLIKALDRIMVTK